MYIWSGNKTVAGAHQAGEGDCDYINGKHGVWSDDIILNIVTVDTKQSSKSTVNVCSLRYQCTQSNTPLQLDELLIESCSQSRDDTLHDTQ